MTMNKFLTAIGIIAVACTTIPGLPGWAASIIAAIGVAASKLASTPLDTKAPKTEAE